MLSIIEQYCTIGVQGYTKVNGKMVCIESFTKRKFGRYPISSLLLQMKLRNPKVEYIKVYYKTPIAVPFLKWYFANGNEMSRKDRDKVWDYSLA